jgi:hypothetical protein
MNRAALEKIIDRRIDARLAELKKHARLPKTPQYVYGLAGLSALLNISRYTAMKLINSGKIPTKGTPKKLMFPVAEVLKIMSRDPAGEIVEAIKSKEVGNGIN